MSTKFELKVKQFKQRDSPLTRMFTLVEIKSAFNLILSGIIFLLLITIANYIFDPQAFLDDMAFLGWAFGKMHVFWLAWVTMHVAIVTVFYSMTVNWLAAQSLIKQSSCSWIYLKAILFAALLSTFAISVAVRYQLSTVMTFALMAEQLRLLMKLYSFVRENHMKLELVNSKDKNLALPSRGQFVFFLFAPTLIYKDSYPRTTSRNLPLVVSYTLQFLVMIFCVFVAIKYSVRPAFEKAGLEPIPFGKLLSSVFHCFMIGIVFLITLFYGFLHCYLNAWAEVLMFGDRLFYEDWWNSTNYGKYYRKWNVVVHDWIYAYVFTDLVRYTKNRAVAALAVFVASAILHEYVITMGFGFFYPVLMLEYGVLGVILFFVTKSLPSWVLEKADHYSGNLFFFFTMFAGWCLLIVLYSMEWFARINCPVSSNESFLQRLIPRTFICVRIAF